MAESDSYQQHEHRDAQVYTDPHGREWNVVLDSKSMAPCAPPMPMGWRAPIMPPLNRLGVPRKPDGKPRLGFLTIDYDGWLADLTQAHRDYATHRAQAAQQIYGQNAGTVLKDPPREFLDYLGTPPQPPELVQLARTGKVRWVLGLPLPGTDTPAPIPAAAHGLMEQLHRAERQSLAVDETPEANDALLAQYGDVEDEGTLADDAVQALDAGDVAALAQFGDADDTDPDGLALVGAGASHSNKSARKGRS